MCLPGAALRLAPARTGVGLLGPVLRCGFFLGATGSKSLYQKKHEFLRNTSLLRCCRIHDTVVMNECLT